MFYLKLALNNIRKSKQNFAPFILASLVLFVMICSTQLILLSPASRQMIQGATVLGLAVVVLTIFAFIMSTYSFNFLMKQRSREFGLYNMLGMNKKQVSLVACLELLMMYVVVVGLGSLLSAIFANLLYLSFVNLAQYDAVDFELTGAGFILTAIIFALIFGLLLLLAIARIGKSSPLILFRSQEKGEKEPRGNILLALLSLLSLGGGYYLSISSTDVSAILIFRFFVAVVLVIIGTYLFYISFMTWYLKKKRTNKAYFYQPEHFITTSQMIFRMKQNAIGLANITLLAIMCFVTIATTTALHTGLTEAISEMFPKNTTLTYPVANREEGEQAFQETVVTKIGRDVADKNSYLSAMLELNTPKDKDWTVTAEAIGNPNYPDISYFYIITQDDFRKFGHKIPELAENQVIIYQPTDKHKVEHLIFVNRPFEVVDNLSDTQFNDVKRTVSGSVLVVSDDTVLQNLQAVYGSHSQQESIGFQYTVQVDLTDDEITSIADYSTLKNEAGETIGYFSTAKEVRSELMAFSGGFLFTGFLLGTAFLLGAALIIYYKQYSEGHEDKKSYRILQEVGMSAKAVKKTINSQIIIVFFMPLLLATLHFVISTVILRQMLTIFGITNSVFFYTVSAVTIVIVILVYYLIYRLTSRTYYRIIER